MMTAAQMNRLLKILGCNHRLVAADGESVQPWIDHALDHLEERLTAEGTKTNG
jgi:hypothetical protein